MFDDAVICDKEILSIIKDICKNDIVMKNPDIELFDNYLVDSLEMVEICLQIEEKFGVDILNLGLEKEDMNTPNKISKLVARAIKVCNLSKKNIKKGLRPSAEKNRGLVLQKFFLDMKNIISVYGSSELNIQEEEYFYPVDFFYENNCNLNVNMVGQGHCQSIIHAINFAALGSELKEKKIVFVISYDWFVTPMNTTYFTKVFSTLQFYSLIFNSSIREDIKISIISRVYELCGEEERWKEIKNICYKYLNKENVTNDQYYVNKYLQLLKEDEYTAKENIEFLKSYNLNNTKDYLNGISWDNEIEKAHKVAKISCNNVLNIDNNYFNTYIKDKLEITLKDVYKNYSLNGSKEYNDLVLLLEICKDVGVKPLFVNTPVNGSWYDYVGWDLDKRKRHYDSIDSIIHKYNYPIVDFSNYEYKKFFLKDIMHIGWKGWVYFSEISYMHYFYGLQNIEIGEKSIKLISTMEEALLYIMNHLFDSNINIVIELLSSMFDATNQIIENLGSISSYAKVDELNISLDKLKIIIYELINKLKLNEIMFDELDFNKLNEAFYFCNKNLKDIVNKVKIHSEGKVII